MRRAELDHATPLWLIPKERAKNNQAHEVPLSAWAAEILDGLPKIKGKPGFVFSTTGKTSVSGFSRVKHRIDELILDALRNAAEERGDDPDKVEPLPRWTFHDLRRTGASGMARLGIQVPIVEKILNHTSGTFAGVVGVYQRHGFSDEKRKALEAWASFVRSIVDGPKKNVVRMRRNA